MQKKQPKGTVSLAHPLQYALFSCMANRFALEREDGFTVAHFGLVNSSGTLLDSFICILPEHTLKSLKENLVQYSDKIGLPKKKMPAWTSRPMIAAPGPDRLTIPVVDFIHVCNWHDAYAEICFWNFSQGYLADVVNSGKDKTVTPNGVALIRCKIDFQRAFLASLYEDAQ